MGYNSFNGVSKITPVHNYLASTQLCIPASSRITPDKRHKIVDLISALSHKFELSKLSLHLAVVCLDKYLSVPCNAKRLFLVGLTSLFLAAKEVEVEPPKGKMVTSLLSSYLSMMEFEEMKALLTKALDYDIQSPTILTFTSYVSDLALEVYSLVPLPLSHAASAVVFVARYITRPDIPPSSAGWLLLHTTELRS